MALDQIDRQLLKLLQDDGRMTNVDLAERVGLTAPPCLRRVRALEDEGAIRGYHAELDPIALETDLAHVHRFKGLQQLIGLLGWQRRHGTGRNGPPAWRLSPLER